MADGEYQLVIPDGFLERPLTGRDLQDFDECPHKFLHAHFVDREETRRFLGGSTALHHAVRGAIIGCYREMCAGTTPAARMYEIFEELWEGDLCADSMEEAKMRAQGHDMLERFAAGWMAENTAALHVDLSLREKIDGVEFTAVGDLIFGAADGEGPLRVVRLTSSRRAASGDMLADDLSAGLLVLLAERHFADNAVEVSYYRLRKGDLQPVVLDEERREYLRRDLVSRASRMRREREFAPRKGIHCRWCRARSRCAVWK